ncbi:MAG: transcriptional repressor [Candidatus Latescibacterota bacterium]|nr:MAG: transcriptional repressor [Candidatus Latescibacterota bacterium]
MARNTQQKTVIRHVFEETGRPMSASEVFENSRKILGRIGIATVYRNLRILLDDGWLTVVSLPGEPNRYEKAGKGHHHHFVCHGCQRVFEVAVCASDLRRMTPSGFQMERHEVVLWGRCAECAE